MVHRLQNIDMQVGKIAGDEKRQYLAPTVLQRLVSAGPSLNDQVDRPGVFALAYHVLAAADFQHPPRTEFFYRSLIIL